MKRKAIALLLVATFLLGCNPSKKIGEQESDVCSTTPVKEVSVEDLENVLQKIKHVASVNYIGEDRVLILAEQMYLVDVSSGRLLAKNKMDESFQGKVKIYRDGENGFAILSIKDKKSSKKKEETFSMTMGDCSYVAVCFYDKNLHCTKEINVNKVWGINTMSVDTVAMDHKKNLAIYDEDTNSLYYCNSATKKKKRILKGKGNRLVFRKELEFSISNDLEFTEDDKKLVFGASCIALSSGGDSTDGYGSVDVNGKHLFVEKIGQEYSVMGYKGEKAVLSQSCGFTEPTGEIYVYDTTNNNRRGMKLVMNEESDNVFLSNQGKRIVTFCEEEENGWKIRFYNSQNGKLIQTKSYGKLNTEKYVDPKILVFEKLNIAILFVRTTEEDCEDVLDVLYL